jgi:hypothetical protein
MAARAAFESGDCLIVRVRTTMAARALRRAAALKVLEGDFLDTTKTGPQQNGNMVIAGVEVDPEGRRVAYHLYSVHPGETVNFQLKVPSKRVLAEDVIYHYEKERPGQLLGVPRLAASIMRLRDVDEYQEALLVKKKIEACFAASSLRPATIGRSSPSVETETTADGTSRRVEKLSPGTIIYGKEGEEVTFGNPSSGPEVGLHRRRAARDRHGSRLHLRAAHGRPVERELLVDARRPLGIQDPRRAVPLALVHAAGVRADLRLVRGGRHLAGKIAHNEIEHIWTPPRWEYVNPKEDVETDLLELKATPCFSLGQAARARRGPRPGPEGDQGRRGRLQSDRCRAGLQHRQGRGSAGAGSCR